MVFKSQLARLRRHVRERQLPRAFVLRELDSAGVTFEAVTLAERNRITTYGYELEYLRAMMDALRADDVLYDVGANIGLVALHAAHRCRTVAFEPDPGFFARLTRNAQLNPKVAVELLFAAITDRSGTVTLYTDGTGRNSPSLKQQRGEKHAVEVTGHTLDQLATRGTLPVPTVIKLDIEGAEVLALRGARHLLNGPDAPRLLFLEVHDTYLPAFNSSADEVLGIVRSAGYSTARYEAKRYEQQHLILARNGSA